MATFVEVLRYLRDNHIQHSIINHRPWASPSELAEATEVGLPIVVRTTFVKADDRWWMVVRPGDRAVDLPRLAAELNAATVVEADPSALDLLAPEWRHTIPAPFGNLFGIPVIADVALRRAKRILFPAGSQTHSVFMRWSDYERLVQPKLASFTREWQEGPAHELQNT